MKPAVKVRFIKAWKFYTKGNVIEPAKMLRDWLLQCKYVEVVKETPEVETATRSATEHAVTRVDKPGRPKRRRQRG